MDADKLLEALRTDSMARLRHLVLRRAGVSPFGLRARLISDARVLEEACFMVLEGEKIPPAAEAASPLYKGGEMGRDEGIPPYGWSGDMAAGVEGRAGRCGHRPLQGEFEASQGAGEIPPVADAAFPLYKGGEMGETPHPSPAATPSPQGEGFKGSLNGGFDMERFKKMKEAADERI